MNKKSIKNITKATKKLRSPMSNTRKLRKIEKDIRELQLKWLKTTDFEGEFDAKVSAWFTPILKDGR